MPTYEYRCPNGHEFEEFFRTISSAQAELSCPTCGAAAQRKVSGGSGLLFKGSGFYITDYGKDGKKNQSAPAPKKDGASGESASSSSEPPTTRDTKAKGKKDE